MGKLTREFEPFKNLWITAADWQKWYETWMNDSLINVDPELLTNSVNNAFKTMHKSLKYFKSVKASGLIQFHASFTAHIMSCAYQKQALQYYNKLVLTFLLDSISLCLFN